MIAPGTTESTLLSLVRAIITNDSAAAWQLLAAIPTLANAHVAQGATRQAANAYYLHEIEHHLYAGDTALHIAAAAYQEEITRKLVTMGADVRARNRRGAEPLHYAVDGVPGSGRWNPRAQVATITSLVEIGADPNATDRGGVTPLHRAVRTRCAAAVRALLESGADPRRKNKNGSTPIQLATQNTGRGGSGSPDSKAQQAEILRLLEQYGSSD
jgi:Ankyrin repeats (many copies)/Ankyrin repeat